MTLGLIHTEVMRAAVRDHLGDPEALALAFHDQTENEVLPFPTAPDRERLLELVA